MDSVRASVAASVRDSVVASVGGSVRDSVAASVWDSVRASVWDSVWDSVVASVWDSVWDSVRASVWDSGYGQHDADWLAFYDFFRNVCGLEKETEKIAPLIDQAKHAGWYLPHANICWVSERHNVLARDERGRLHSLGGPAVMYPDGWKIYAVHGVRIPLEKAHIIEKPETITHEEIDAEGNAEVRRVMLDRFGTARYLQATNTKPVHTDDFGTLYRREVPGDEPIVMVKVVNSTPEPDGSRKDYWLRVPPTVKRAREAVAWTFGMEERGYLPEVQT
jgi:hypothetical protein